MSTRRARIKAVVALPPRRKNTDNANKANTSKDDIVKPPKSPRTPKTNIILNEEKNSPKSTIRSPPSLNSIDPGPKTPVPNTTALEVTLVHNETQRKAGKVAVITTTPSRNVFALPSARNSPDRRQASYNVTISSLKPGKKCDEAIVNYPGSEKDNYILDDYPPSPSESIQEEVNVLENIVPLPTPSSTAKIEMLKNEIIKGIGEVSFDPIVPLPSPVKVRPKLRPVPRLAPLRNVQAKGSPDRRRVASPVVLSSPKQFRSNVNTPPPNNNEKTAGTPGRQKSNSFSEDYNVPSVSSSTENVLDSIVPLPAAKNSKTADILKKEILSETAEVSFDPIVPLPSPCKVRPKIRPVPRLAPYRRNSVQGSASESEDESRRVLHGTAPAPPRPRLDSHTSLNTLQSATSREANRNRNDSVCSSVSQVATQPPPATSPVKEKHVSKSRRQEMSRRSWWRRREVKRDALTMFDLIFFNPTTNPIVPDQDEINAKEANAKEEAERSNKEAEAETAGEKDAGGEGEGEGPSDSAPVPQIKLGPNGEIILDEQSLVINQSDSNRKVSSVVREGSWAGAGGGRYTRSARTADWSGAETVRFYRALAAIGTDFTLMAPLFPARTRKDLYLKFKKEEKLNGGQVDKALRSATSWDLSRLQKEFKEERAAAAKQAELARQKLLENKKAERERLKVSKELRVRPSRAAKALESLMLPGASSQTLTADEFVERHLETRQTRKRTQKATAKEKPAEAERTGDFATLSISSTDDQASRVINSDLAVTRVDPWSQSRQVSLNEVAGVPKNIETGSLVVLRVNDPASPSKTMLQTYIAHGSGKLTPVALPSTFLNSVVGYMKKGTPKSTISNASSPSLLSPNSNSMASQDSRSGTPSVIQLNPSPTKRQRHSSYTITSL